MKSKISILLIILIVSLSNIGIVHAESSLEPGVYFVQKEGNVDDSWIIKAEIEYRKIPKEIREDFEKNSNGEIFVTDKDLAKEYGFKYNIMGIYTEKKKHYEGSEEILWYQGTIKVEDREEAMTALIHEIGHYIDYTHDTISETEEFKGIKAEEVGELAYYFKPNKGNYKNTEEYFAESFKYYILEPEELEKRCPKTFRYIDKIVKSYSKEIIK